MGSYYHPSNIKEALQLAANNSGNYMYFSGGTDLQIYRKQGLENSETIIDLNAIEVSERILVKNASLQMSAFTFLEEISLSKDIQLHFPLLAQAANSVATPVIRKTATIGGNILVNNRCTFYNQSKEWRQAVGSCMRDVGDICQVTGGKNKCYSRNVSDTAPALIALNASVVVHNQEGEEEIPLKDLYSPDGIIFHQHLDKDAILKKINIPEKPKTWWFKKLRLRKTLDFTSLTLAAVVDNKDIVRICINGMSMSPILIEESLHSLTIENLLKQARKNCKTVDNDLMPMKYRKEMMNVFLKQWWSTVYNE